MCNKGKTLINIIILFVYKEFTKTFKILFRILRFIFVILYKKILGNNWSRSKYFTNLTYTAGTRLNSKFCLNTNDWVMGCIMFNNIKFKI